MNSPPVSLVAFAILFAYALAASWLIARIAKKNPRALWEAHPLYQEQPHQEPPPPPRNQALIILGPWDSIEDGRVIQKTDRGF